MAEMSPLDQMKSVSQKYQKASDLMQDAATVKEQEVEVQDGRGPRTPQSFSKPQAQAVKQHNVNNQNTINHHFVQSQDDQTQRMDKQIQLAQQQSQTMKQLHGTMEELLHLMQREANKIEPKYQEFAKPGGPAGINGEAKDGMIDKLGEMIGGAFGGLGDLLGGGRGRDRGGRNSRRDRNGNRSGGRSGGGWVDRLKDRIRGSNTGGGGGSPRGTPRFGGGWRGRLLGAATNIGGRVLSSPVGRTAAAGAVAYGGFKAYEGLGSISAGNESTKGVHEISSGKGDHGGVSYGAHQLASRNGSMAKFLASKEGQPFAGEFAGLTPGSGAFNMKYAQVASSQEEAFAKAQKSYINRTHYEPMVNNVLKGTGMDFSTKGKAVQEMLYSTGVQYGSGTSVVNNALRGKNVANMSDAEIIAAVQDYKAATVDRYFASSAPNIQASVAKRAIKEKAQLLAFNQQELQAKANGEETADTGATAEGVSMTDVASATGVSSAGPMAMAAVPSGGDTGSGAAVAGGAAALGTGALLMANRGTPAPTVAPVTAPTPPIAPTATPTPAPHTGAAPAKGMVKGAAKTVGRTVSRALPGANIALGGYDAYQIITDEEASRAEKERALSQTAGGTAGAAAGAATGAALGTLVFPVVGTAIGGLIGGGLGYWGGSEAAGGTYDAVAGSPAEQAARDAAKANAPVVGSTPLVMAQSATPDAAAAKAMSSVDAAIKSATAGLKPDAAAAVDAAKAATAGTVAAAIPTAGALASSVPQSMADAKTMASGALSTGASGIGGALTGMAAGLMGMGLPDGWAESIMSSYSGAMATQSAAMSGSSPASNIPLPMTATAPVVTAAPVNRGVSTTPSAASVVAVSPMANNAAPPTSPANPSYYRDSDVSPQAAAATPTPSASTVSTAQASPSAVTSTGAHAAPVERAQHDPVQKVMMIEPKRQDTMMPDRFKPAGQRISSKGVSEGNSIRQTLDDAPAIISDSGLVLLQTGYI